MTRAGAVREVWHPHTVHDREVVLRELAEVLASPHFCNSKRYPALLKYIVEKTLAGEADQLKERTVGVEVFDRPADYDTNADTVVRYTAGEVRKRLSLYYHELDRRAAVHISLPAGSYVPEFVIAHDAEGDVFPVEHAETHSGIAIREPEFPAVHSHSSSDGPLLHGDRARPGARRWGWLVLLILFVVAGVAGGWRYRTLHPRTALEDFWAPLREQSPVMVCIGGSVFDQTHLSGVSTAGKDTDYPFVSLQSASALAQLSTLLAKQGGVATEVRAAANTPLTELREHPLVLVGGYNNQWTTRLLQPLQIHFVPGPTEHEGIVDSRQPGSKWIRDLSSLPYSSADDYAVVARFRDSNTDSWVMTLAGVGRNGTEAAAHFATSPHYIQQLRDRIGDFGNRNIEVVLKVSVVDGKTGAPTVQAVAVW
ncbi:MAG TPA: hypothetical protein VN612_06065 [Acidobacteriaceae bacterium]|nr:hypothetical protein [Acidobacteriaceae bacterium]